MCLFRCTPQREICRLICGLGQGKVVQSIHDERYLRRAIELAKAGMHSGQGGPFGALVVRKNQIIAEGCNRVTIDNDPTAHAEIVAIRRACARLDSFQLHDCVIYASCEPCPMCLSAIYWSRAARIVYAGSRYDAADVGFDDDVIYRELALQPGERGIAMQQLLSAQGRQLLLEWGGLEHKVDY